MLNVRESVNGVVYTVDTLQILELSVPSVLFFSLGFLCFNVNFSIE